MFKPLSEWRILRRLFYRDDWEPKRCPHCFASSKHLRETPIDSIANITCEKTVVCAKCDSVASYWSYGCYEPPAYGK